MQAIKKSECVDVLSNMRQIDLGHKIAKANQKHVYIQPKLQKLIRSTSALQQQGRHKMLSFKSTKIKIEQSQKTIENVTEQHLAFINKKRNSH